MKKVFSIVCALLMIVGANAMTVKSNKMASRHNAPVETSSPDNAMARKASETAGDYFISFSVGETFLAAAYIQTASDASLSGVYAVGSPYSGYINSTSTTVSAGLLVIDYVSDAEATGTYVQKNYKVKAINWVASDGKVYNFESDLVTTLAFSGTMQSPTLITLTDKTPLDIVEVPLTDEVENDFIYDDETNPTACLGWYVTGMNDTSSALIVMVKTMTQGSDIFGVYTEDMIDEETSVVYIGETKKTISSGVGLVVEDSEGNALLDFFLLGKDGKYYYIYDDENGGGGEPHDPFEADATSKVSMEFDDYDLDDSYLEDYNAMFLTATNDDDQEIQLMFIVGSTAADDDIADGEYEINDSEKKGSVLASVGNDSTYGPQPSLAMQDDFDKVWFLVEGTVTVSHVKQGKKEILSIEVSAKNSNGKKVTAHIGAENPESALVNINADAIKAEKVMVDGQLYIVRDNHLYNAQGVVVE